MKGIVFTEFLDMVEARFDANMVDDIIDDAKLPSGGIYTSVGTYPHEEMTALVTALSLRSSIQVSELLNLYGQHLFSRFSKIFPQFMEGHSKALEFLAGIEDVIHAEVLKLYPDAQLPRFEVLFKDERRLDLLYSSSRHLEDLAEGLLRGCVDFFKEDIRCERLTEANSATQVSTTRFILTLG